MRIESKVAVGRIVTENRFKIHHDQRICVDSSGEKTCKMFGYLAGRERVLLISKYLRLRKSFEKFVR